MLDKGYFPQAKNRKRHTPQESGANKGRVTLYISSTCLFHSKLRVFYGAVLRIKVRLAAAS